MSTGFAYFGAQMIQEFKDEYSKGDVLGLSFMGGLKLGEAEELSGLRGVQVHDVSQELIKTPIADFHLTFVHGTQRAFTEGQFIRSLMENSALLVPIQCPEETWLSPSIPPFDINSPNPIPPVSFNLSNPDINLDVRHLERERTASL